MSVAKSNNRSLLYSHSSIFFICFFISSFSVTFSYGAPRVLPAPFSDGREIRNAVDTRRIAAEIHLSNSTAPSPEAASTKLILAAKRTHRRCPADGFNYYDGGWNVSDSHYLYSVAFSAAPPLLAGIIWFILFGLWLLGMIIRFCCCCCCSCCRPRRQRNIDHNRTAYTITFSLLLLFTLACIVGGIVAYVGEEKLERSVVKVTLYVLDQADVAFGNLRNLINNLLAAKKIGVDQLGLPAEVQSQIDQIGGKINYYADKLHTVSKHSTVDIWMFMRPIRRTLISVAIGLLALILLGFFIAAFGLKFLIYCLVIIGWIVVTAAFILTAMFLLIHNVVADSCVALDDWLQNPMADSAIENIIPRLDNETSQKIYSTTRKVTYGVVNVINSDIINVTNVNMPPSAGPLYYNQSGPLMPLLCNPLHPDLSDRKCLPGEVTFDDASQVWSNFVCQVSDKGICTTPGRLTPNGYNQLLVTTNISQVLYEEGPFLMSLVDSTFVINLFQSLMDNNCPGLSNYSKMTYAGLLAASILLLLSVVAWIVHGEYARQRRLAT
ncbi:uncharacterized protein LOC108213620 [Daucus carota subsp. sativus]|uniref:uncharacterized protein LOC108213620 n=1 Tax=Daucus carota subsp. sativus TaxID=79200 RepID=UPI0007F006BB|nr:PREDICTED: uncharacterized protein LOC108213620 [Daucus carota subsp. sativus]